MVISSFRDAEALTSRSASSFREVQEHVLKARLPEAHGGDVDAMPLARAITSGTSAPHVHGEGHLALVARDPADPRLRPQQPDQLPFSPATSRVMTSPPRVSFRWRFIDGHELPVVHDGTRSER